MAGIIVAEEKPAAFGIGEAAEDLEVVVVPSGFPFGGLVFGHSGESEKDGMRNGREVVSRTARITTW